MKTYLILFFTHSGAIKFQRNIRSFGADCTLMPVPRVLSSSCGICGKLSTLDDIKVFLNEDVEKVFLESEKTYTLVFTQD